MQIAESYILRKQSEWIWLDRFSVMQSFNRRGLFVLNTIHFISTAWWIHSSLLIQIEDALK